MEPNTQQVNQENSISQEKIDTNLQQQKVDTNITQNAQEEANVDPNWKAFREARKQDRIAKEAAEKRAKEKEEEAEALKLAMAAAFAKTSNYPQQNQYESGYQEETEDERIEKKVQAIIEQRENAYEKKRFERELQEYPQRLIANYSDFNETISNENLDYLDYHYPEVTRPLKRLQDGYEKWEDIYKSVKKFVPNASSSKKDAARAENNFNKPKSMSSTSLTQTGETVGSARLTAEKRAANWEAMQKRLKSVG